MCERQHKDLHWGTVKSNAPDVPIMMPHDQYVDGSSKLKETEDTVELELDSGY